MSPTAEEDGGVIAAVTLYENDFEGATNEEPERREGLPNFIHALPGRLNDYFGPPAVPKIGPPKFFNENINLETVFVTNSISLDNGQPYQDPTGTGGDFAIGFQNIFDDDQMAISIDLGGRCGVEVSFDATPLYFINWTGIRRPYADAAFTVSVLDDPNAVAALDGALLDSDTGFCPRGSDQITFNWTRHTLTLDASGSTNGIVSIRFGVTSGNYAVLDNIVI
ncbi:MAG: hypothetical protein SGARI_004007, partial [Bacillariaceae sp.]